MLICLQCDRLSPARGVPFCTILAHMAGAKLYRSYGLITDELIKPGRASLAISPSPWRVPPSPKWASLAWASQFCTVWGCENKLPVSFQTHLFIFSNSHNSDVGLKWHTEGPGHVDLFFVCHWYLRRQGSQAAEDRHTSKRRFSGFVSEGKKWVCSTYGDSSDSL